MAGYTIGMDQVYFAKLLSDTKAGATYAPPVEIGKAVSGTIAPQIANAKKYANDVLAANINEVTGAEVTLALDELNANAKELVFGIEKNTDGALVYGSKALAPDGALLFRSKLHNGGYRYVVLYKGSFALAEDQYNTKSDGIEIPDKEITGTFGLREFDGNWKTEMDDNDEGVNLTAIKDWFTTVYNPNPTIEG